MERHHPHLAPHESNGLVERKIGQSNESTRASLLASDLPAYLWPEVYMALCHTQNIVLSSVLQRELKKKKEHEEKWRNQEEAAGGEGKSAPREQGEAKAKAAAESPIPDRDMIPYLVFYRDVTEEQFQQLVSLLKPWGVPVLVYHRRDNMHQPETRGQKEFYMGPRSGLSMDRVFLWAGWSRAVKQFRHVLVPPAIAQKHAMRMHRGRQHAPTELYVRAVTEEPGDAFQNHSCRP